MQTEINNIDKKKKYTTPELQCIKLDNAISLQLESDPASGPNESMDLRSHFDNSPFQNTYRG